MPRPSRNHQHDADIPVSPGRIGRAVSQALNAARDPALDRTLGWLRVRKLVSDRQFEAGSKFRDLAVQYAKAVASRRRTPRSASLDRAGGRGIPLPENIGRVRANIRVYEECRQRFRSVAAYDVVIATVIDDQPPSNIDTLRRGLGELVQFFRV